MAKILIAKEDGDVRRLLLLLLSRAGHAVDIVDDASEALQVLENGHFDLLLADATPAGGDGVRLARHASSRAPAMQVMIITGFAAVSVRMRRTAGGGCVPAVSGPFHLRQLAQHIDVVLSA